IYSLAVSFLPVSRTFSALLTTTKSPASRWGVYTGLFLPRKISATCTANRPSTAPSASITCHFRWSKFTLGKCVFIQTEKERGVYQTPERSQQGISAAIESFQIHE